MKHQSESTAKVKETHTQRIILHTVRQVNSEVDGLTHISLACISDVYIWEGFSELCVDVAPCVCYCIGVCIY